MDFMNFMNQINGCGANCGCDFNNPNMGCDGGNGRGYGSNIWPLLLLAGLGNGYGQSNFSGGNMTCYPNNNCGHFITQTSMPCYDSNLKYRTRKVKQAYMEVPVSTYQVAQPFLGPQNPTTMSIIPNNFGGNRNGIDIWTIIILLMLLGSKSNNNNVCCSHPRSCGNISQEV